MALPTWIQDALHSKIKPLKGQYWRCVEAQHIVSTLQLVDSLEDQALLEDILEESKPPIPKECAGLHWLYSTPFRYGLYPNGSRFRKAGRTPGVYYASQHARSAIIETAFHILLFYVDSPETPFPERPSEHTLFDVPIKTTHAISLMEKPFIDASDLWMHPNTYGPCQEFEILARDAGIKVIQYTSVRDPANLENVAILDCKAFASKTPSIQKNWKLWFNKNGMHAISDVANENFSLAPENFLHDDRFSRFKWN
ncbi:RES family NAD+ phosphorylase [Hirschia baltica]|uniref:RES domain protein n=1 Tax=Hirschia baltica (strain ATCC 49814 / DSM 5838 / IFAM 1418) TaxID=582402 RepID=C6XP83_HIRBI|nr:RES family NAD+ phosphorylase [Hirschia baltica]ACT58369.1 RES domain protein [Hirschia baltica ATCC 49814]